MFVNSDYLDYDYLVEYSDNYVVLSKNSSVSAIFESPRTIPVLVQYFTPSIVCLESTRTYRSYTEFSPIEVTDNFYERADCPVIMLAIFCCLFFVLFLINGLTRFVKRGGIFFGH